MLMMMLVVAMKMSMIVIIMLRLARLLYLPTMSTECLDNILLETWL